MEKGNSLVLSARAARAFRFLSSVRGWRRFVGSLVPPHAAEFVVNNRGVLFSGNFQSILDREVYLFGSYERRQLQRFLELVPKTRRSVILDVGANAGNHTLFFAKYFSAVHSFEPNPMLWEQFERNVRLNGLNDRVGLHKIGLADRDDTLKLHMIEKPNLGLGTFSTVEQYDLPLVPIADCEIRSGSSYLKSKGISKIDAVKIDVQGFEPEVLRGLREVLECDRPLLWVEVGAGTRTQVSIRSDLSALIPFDFRCYLISARTVVEIAGHDSNLPAGDYVLVPV